ncbi:ABC transporter permease [Niabella sp. CJ426]|uniref:ABC transporter permease n=1 Tax=Niabella sp. CJ426 TaxID=3393740 RepID=UPI003D01DC62
MIRLAFKNLTHNGLSSVLSWVSLSLSICIISILMVLQNSYERQFLKNIEGIDMVLGAKGSPLQLILSSVFHIDAPTGNISFEDAQKWMNHPYVKQAIPLAYGDSYKGTPIVGSNHSLLQHYGGRVTRGRIFNRDFEVVIGSNVAQKLMLKQGQQFYSAHGHDEHGEEHRDHPYTVTGVLAPTATVLDDIIVSNIESVWKMHEPHDHNQQVQVIPEHQVPGSGPGGHQHDEVERSESAKKELTAVLISFTNPMGIVQLPRIINKQTNLMPAIPAIELNRMFSILGIGIDVLTYVGAGIMLLSAFSIFVALYNSLTARKYETALLRATGTSRWEIILLFISEGLLLGIGGVITGILLSRCLLFFITGYFSSGYHMHISVTGWLLNRELYLIAGAMLITLFAALIPALKAGFINLSKALAHG